MGNTCFWMDAGARSTNPNTTLVEWTSLPANIQTIEVGYADAYASTNNAENERIVLRLGTSAGYLTSNYKNRSWNMYASTVGLGFNSSRGMHLFLIIGLIILIVQLICLY